MRDIQRIEQITREFLRAEGIDEQFAVHGPTVVEDCYLIKFENEKLPILQLDIPLEEPIAEHLTTRLKNLMIHRLD